MRGKPDIIFDTSSLNALADDPHVRTIVTGLNIGFRVRLSETSVSEIVATDKPERRISLLDLCTQLVHAGEALVPHHEVLQRMSRAHADNPAGFDWRRVDVRWRDLEEEIARRTFIVDPETARDVRIDNKASNKRFEQMWRDPRTQFEAALSTDDAQQISMESVFQTLEADGSPLWELAADIYKTETNIELSRYAARVFVESCPPAKAMLLACCVGQYHWGLKSLRTEAKYKAGRLDLFSATYLPYCSKFITNDPGQCNALGLVSQKAGLATEVCMYADFRTSLLIAA